MRQVNGQNELVAFLLYLNIRCHCRHLCFAFERRLCAPILYHLRLRIYTVSSFESR